MVKAFPLELFIKEGSGDGFKQYKGASTHPQVFCDKYESAEIMQSLLALFSFPPVSLIPFLQALQKGGNMESKSSRQPNKEQGFDTCTAQTCLQDINWQISDSFPCRCPLRGISKLWVPRRPDLKRHHSTQTTQQKSQRAFQGKIPNHLLLQSHFSFRATTQRPVWLSIQVWCIGRKRDGWRTIDALSLFSLVHLD